MPDYSEYIIVEKGVHNYYTNYRGDYTFYSDIFLGPMLTKEFILRQHVREYSIRDNAYSRILLDFDTKYLLIRENGIGIFATEVLLRLLEYRYENWQIVFAEKGDISFLEYLKKDVPKSSLENRIRHLEKWAWDESKGVFVSIENQSTYKEYWVDKSLHEVISMGPDLLKTIEGHEIKKVDEFPQGGLHINLDGNQIFFWNTDTEDCLEEWMKRQWVDFEIELEFRGYEKHFKLLKTNLFQKEIEKETAQQISELKKYIINSYTIYDNARNSRYKDELEITDIQTRSIYFEEAFSKISRSTGNKN